MGLSASPLTSRKSLSTEAARSCDLLSLKVNFADICLSVLTDRVGGDDGIRTHDPLLAGQVLSQLSYTPIFAADSLSHSLKIEQ